MLFILICGFVPLGRFLPGAATNECNCIGNCRCSCRVEVCVSAAVSGAEATDEPGGLRREAMHRGPVDRQRSAGQQHFRGGMDQERPQ
ncbi:exported hypothetical protein [Actinacidiphila cocklensis]|uniref:Uncharacterized protein n=1 Tax=Actinacidiphila cocklensis TaxID=887465 RepID=A0A9W4GTT3_9ACTN|nr:exported hypothetical protein [Actinacidiphila cocklensis]